MRSDITEESDNSVEVIDGLIEKDEALSAGGAKTSTASQNTESLPELSFSSGQPVGSAPSENVCRVYPNLVFLINVIF